MRILVTLLLETLPALGNILLLCLFVFYIFGIVGVQLWAGILRNRCFMPDDVKTLYNLSMSSYYMGEEGEDNPFICSTIRANGMLRCSDVPHLNEGVECTLNPPPLGHAYGLNGTNNSCINWNLYYNVCEAGELNPHKGAVNFDNIGYAWIAIFQVITLEGWADIMYYVMDAHSFFNFIYFIFLIIVGSFFMINLCLVVIATQFAETKQCKSQQMQNLARYSELGSCYKEMLEYISRLYRKVWKNRNKVHPISVLSGGGGAGGGGSGDGVTGHSMSIHNLLEQHQQQHLSNGNPSPVASTGPGEALEMVSNGNYYGGTINYPTIFPTMDPFEKLHQLIGEHSHSRVLSQIAGVVPAQMLLELLSCPFCARALETIDLELTDSEGEMVSNGAEPSRANTLAIRLPQYWENFRDKLTQIVDSKYFNQGIMFAILLNTLSMGIEHHDQPEVLTTILEISNIIFTCIFVLEVFSKLLAFGVFKYIMNPYNVFDGIIVVISVWEILGQMDGGLSVLRTFRLLRVLKLVRFLPSLHRQLMVLMKSMENVATFCMLLMLFIFTFSILGMNLFGCKFNLKMENGDTIPHRKNFDSLLWAIVTVFQILTQEDWNVVLYNGMASTSPWAALYFVALITFGNYVLFNILVAILVEGFQAETSPRSSPCHSSDSGSNSGSRRSSWTGQAPSLRRKDTAGDRESLLSGKGRGSFEDEDLDNISGGLLQDPSSLDPQFPVCSFWEKHLDWNRRSLYLHTDLSSNLSEDDSMAEEHMDDSFCLRLKRRLEAYKPKWCKNHEDWSLYLFSPQSKSRMMCQRLISYKMFDHIVLVFVALNCITIAMERPTMQPSERLFLSVSNYIFTGIFLAEMTVKVVALGFFSGKESYLKSNWNVLDGILVLVALVDILVSLAQGGHQIFGILRVLRLLRSLRPLRVINRAPGLKLVVETLIRSLKPIGNIILICCAFFIIFGILGVQLFKGKFFHCEGSDTNNINNKVDCDDAGYKWTRRKYNFDDLGQALMSLFILSCKDGWVDIMYDGLDAVGVDQQPQRNHNPWMLLYFLSFMLLVSFFVLNMFVGVLVENFHKCRQDQKEEEARLREEKRQKLLEKKRRSKENCGSEAQERPYYTDYSPARLYIHKLCTNHYLDVFITCIIGINMITMSVEHFNQPLYLEEALKYCNYAFTVVFVIEALLKLVAFGFQRFFKDRWNQLDLAIVLLSIIGITLEEIKMNSALPINPTIIRIMRVLRIARVLKLLKMATGMRALLDTIKQALPQVGDLGLLFILFYFIYAALGVELFGKLECSDRYPCEGLSRHATFENFGMAFLTLFRVSTGDNWSGIMKDTLRDCPSSEECFTYLPVISPIYFVTFVLMAQLVLVNVVVAVLMKHLEDSNKEAKDAEMDAVIEMEMIRDRRLSNVSAGSSSGPEEDAEMDAVIEMEVIRDRRLSNVSAGSSSGPEEDAEMDAVIEMEMIRDWHLSSVSAGSSSGPEEDAEMDAVIEMEMISDWHLSSVSTGSSSGPEEDAEMDAVIEMEMISDWHLSSVSTGSSSGPEEDAEMDAVIEMEMIRDWHLSSVSTGSSSGPEEDAEMDAVIEMEMTRDRRLSNVSAGSSSGPEVRETYVEDEGCKGGDASDSYMFHPVRSATGGSGDLPRHFLEDFFFQPRKATRKLPHFHPNFYFRKIRHIM
ncbi:voltage-dependent T-type calcium channel subunit alpha-1H-like isoform X2 [Pseudorasbora parva]|uniref:voltage-dependent T-type calcium channel subunit alpha-1H-like isoform X2 n=1 Tax=Pseudorasbora parva TaxID=51549 RepID=UPI00351DC7F0